MTFISRSSCGALIKDYCANCSFAGVHFIADETKHWIERLIWLILVILSWYGSGLLIIAAWDSFVENPISFGVETTYLNWDTKMPAVAICEMGNDDKVYAISDEIWPPGHLIDLEDALRDIAYFRGVSYRLVDVCYLTKDPDPLCPTTNFLYYVNLIRSGCEQIMRNCSYNDKEFACCEYFQPIATDIGTCFVINSIQTEKPNPYPMVSNLKHNRGSLKFEVSLSSMMYTLGEDEVPSITSLQSSTLRIQLGRSYRRQLTVRSIENDPLIRDNTPEQRACRFYNENENGVYPKYSYSACTVGCRKKGQIKKCGCNDHFMIGANDSERCNISGIACLHQFSMHLTTLKPNWDKRPGLACDCMPSCNETEITVIKDIDTVFKGKGNKKKPAKVEVMLAYLATERFKRNVVRSRMDLVVSIGGTTGLFVGASLLSFVELIFYFTVRFISNILMDHRRQRRNGQLIRAIAIHDEPKVLSVGDVKLTHNDKALTMDAPYDYVHNRLILPRDYDFDTDQLYYLD